MHALRSSQNFCSCFNLGAGGRTNKRRVQQRGSRHIKMTTLMKSYPYVIACNAPNKINIRVLWTGKIIIVLMLKDQQQQSFKDAHRDVEQKGTMARGLSVTLKCLEAVSVMHTVLMSNFWISRLLTEAMLWSSAVIFPKGERAEKGLELEREGKHIGRVDLNWFTTIRKMLFFPLKI